MNRRKKLSLGILLSAGIWILCLGQPKADKNLPAGPPSPPSAIFDPASQIKDSPAKSLPQKPGIRADSGDGYWDDRFFLGGANGTVDALIVNGPDVYAGGNFTTFDGLTVNYIAKWDGTSWSALGTGMNGSVYALMVSGTDLYAGGYFTTAGGVTVNNIAKWDGTSWSALGSGMRPEAGFVGSVSALATDGTNLYAGGQFKTAGGVEVNHVAKWDGSSWSALGTGIFGDVRTLAVSGVNLYAGGFFSTTGGGPVNGIAKWDGTSWSALGTGTNGSVRALAAIGTDLYAGGEFTTAGGAPATYIAKWDGTTWSSLGSLISGGASVGCVYALATDGTNVYAGGWFTTAGGVTVNNIAKWDGTSWSALGKGMDSIVSALAVSGTSLYALGNLAAAGIFPRSVAKWNGGAWMNMAKSGKGFSDPVYSLLASGTDVYAGGWFTAAEGVTVNNIAKWDGTNWTALGSGIPGGGFAEYISALATDGTNLYAGGWLVSAGGAFVNNVFKWDGTLWSALGTGMNGIVHALEVSGTNLFAGGGLTTAGGVAANNIAKWDGTSWSALGTGLSGGEIRAVAAIGTDLYAGGDFKTAGGVTANYIAKWNGTTWSALGTGMDASVHALEVSGTNLYAGGLFTTAGGAPANCIAKWDGTSWSALGTGMDGSVNALAVSGTNLYAGGLFTKSGGVTVNYIAKWDGTSWSALEAGMNGSVGALAVSGTDLYAGGAFSKAGSFASNNIAHWIRYPLSVTSPNGGEIWLIGTRHDIAWSTSVQIANVKIEYSVDGGSSWTTITGSTANSGIYPWNVPNAPSTNCLVRISDAANTATADFSDAVFTIGGYQPPVIDLSRKALNFGSIQGGGGIGISSVATSDIATSAQTVIISNSGSFTLNWTAISDKGWLRVTPGSGRETGVIQIAVYPDGLAAGTYTGTITVSDQNAADNPQTIAVTLTVMTSETSAVPFGDFATPIDGTTRIAGAIPVTGWALDDVETTRIRIKRNPDMSDPAGAIGPDGLVFIGDGIFVDGARPDVEAIYSGFPLNYRAGWGYMLLTNFLPAQGNGTYKLYAIATDKEGNTVTIGTKTITCDNAHAVKPFGTIDTPAQGAEISGNPYLNFGWVLTPLPKTVAKDGSTIEVYVDGVKVGNLSTAPNVYNQYRVDVATAFPGLNNSGGPVGAFFLDTTAYPNGVHMISWTATDDQRAADGIGSRYFTILNTAGAASVDYTLNRPHPLGVANMQELSHCEPLGVAIRPFGSSRALRGISSTLATVEDILNLPLSFESISLRHGFNTAAPPEIVAPDNFGAYHIDIKEVELLKISLGPDWIEVDNPPTPPFRKGGDEGKPTSRRDRIEGKSMDMEGEMDVRCAGYLVIGEELRPLPIGSTLDAQRGVFSWLPGPGFLGEYELVFIAKDAFGVQRRIPVQVTIKPKFGR